MTPEFFQTTGIALLRGRTFTEADSAAKTRVVMVNQDFADRYFHGEEPLGKQIQLDVSGEPGVERDRRDCRQRQGVLRIVARRS